MKANRVITGDAMVGWKVPAHIKAVPAPDAQTVANTDSAARAHHLMVSVDGGLHPVMLTGYHTDRALPGRFMRELACRDLAALARTGNAEVDRFGVLMEVWASSEPVHGQFNAYGSLLAADFGFAVVPLYGMVFFARRAGEDGVTAKLPVVVKDEVRNRFWVATQVLSGIRPEGVSEQAYRNTWLTVQDLLNAHDKQHETSQFG